MLTIACVYKSETDGPYGPEDVHRLADGVHAHLTIPYRFLCLSDVAASFSCQHVNAAARLEHGWRGWWAKMNIFAIPGPVLYLDLDTVIVGSLDELAYRVIESDKLLMLRGFYRGDRCSGIMGWGEGVSTQWILDSFISDLRTPPAYVQTETALRMTMKSKTFRGDQEWLDHLLGEDQTAFVQSVASGIYSYKVNIKDHGLPEDARVVCFHGKPRPREVAHLPWMQEHWTGKKAEVEAA